MRQFARSRITSVTSTTLGCWCAARGSLFSMDAVRIGLFCQCLIGAVATFDQPSSGQVKDLLGGVFVDPQRSASCGALRENGIHRIFPPSLKVTRRPGTSAAPAGYQ